MDRSEISERPLTGTQWTIAADGHEATVVEVGGGLRAYRANGVEYVDGYAEDEVCVGCAGQILAPWPNRIRDGRYTFAGAEQQLALTEPERHNAIHGLVNWMPWQVESHSSDALTVCCELPAQKGYPWPLLLRTHWRIGADGLRSRQEVINVGRSACPFGFAVHPYLQVPGVAVDDLVMRVPARRRVLVDSRLLPVGMAAVAGTEYDFTTPRRIGTTVLDTAFGELGRDADGGSRIMLADPDSSRAVTLWADAAFGWWQVFTGDALTGERYRRSVAVEPMTCPPDAFRSGRDVLVLEPGQHWCGQWGIRPGIREDEDA